MRCIVLLIIAVTTLSVVSCSTDRSVVHRLDEAVSFEPPSGFLRVPYRAQRDAARGALFENARTDVAGTIRFEIIPFAARDDQSCARSLAELRRRTAGTARRGSLAGRPAVVVESTAQINRPDVGRQLRRVRRYAFFLDENRVLNIALTADSKELLQVMETSLRSLDLQTGPLDDDDLVPHSVMRARSRRCGRSWSTAI